MLYEETRDDAEDMPAHALLGGRGRGRIKVV